MWRQLSGQGNILSWPVLVLLLVILAELSAILVLNDGHFMFALDDPYIHLSLAENIRHGHYGVNAGEYAAPSSSILWPFLIAPMAASEYASWFILLLNAAFAISTLLLVQQMLRDAGRHWQISLPMQNTVLVFFMLATNLAGLAFIGMEHSLQVLLAVLIGKGMTDKLKGNEVSSVWLLAVVSAPLVRYENLVISGAAILFCLLRREFVVAIAMAVLVAMLLAMYSAFLLGIGLNYLPDSVLAKSVVAASGLGKLMGNLKGNLLLPNTPKAVVMILMTVFLLALSCCRRLGNPWRLALLSGVLALALHLCGGRIGWYFRYEMALWAFVLVLFLNALAMLACTSPHARITRLGRKLAILVAVVAALEGLVAGLTTPLAASNVYHQQYQMHRFITEIYRQPVAVNDLGWASYRNNDYVLDLWGLGSSQARGLRKENSDPQWMDDLAEQKQVELAMIYHHHTWFPEVPPTWIKVAELDITGPKITVWYPVSFYVRREAAVADLVRQLKTFAASLPPGSVIRFTR